MISLSTTEQSSHVSVTAITAARDCWAISFSSSILDNKLLTFRCKQCRPFFSKHLNLYRGIFDGRCSLQPSLVVTGSVPLLSLSPRPKMMAKRHWDLHQWETKAAPDWANTCYIDGKTSFLYLPSPGISDDTTEHAKWVHSSQQSNDTAGELSRTALPHRTHE